jgi:spermidine/putrescine transport system substrate-binding protein
MLKQLIAVAVSLLFAVSVHAQKNRLNLFIWSEYMDPEIIADFEKEFDCKVTIDLYEDNESMLAKLQGGGTSLYDIVVPSDYIVVPLVRLRLIQPLRHENIPNMKNIASEFANPPFDPGNRYSAPYQWGTVGIYLRRAKDEKIDETWGLIFDPAKQPGPFLLIDDQRPMIGAALRYLGYSMNSTSKKELREARDLLLEAKRRSVGFAGGVEGKNRVLARGVKMAVVYNGDAVRGTHQDPETYYFVPREGSEIWLDSMCIPSRAPNRDMAEKFINYILDPKVGARLSNFNRYATPNAAAKPFINPEDLKNPAVYPPPEVMKTLEYTADLGIHSRLYDEVWTYIKAR